MEKNKPAAGDIYIFPAWRKGLGVICPCERGRFSGVVNLISAGKKYLIFRDGWGDLETLFQDDEVFCIHVHETELDAYKMIYPNINWHDLEALKKEAEE